jgi:hypothetical protein
MSVTGLVVGILGVLYSLLAVVLVVFVLIVEGAYYDDPYVYVDYTTEAVLPRILALVQLR